MKIDSIAKTLITKLAIINLSSILDFFTNFQIINFQALKFVSKF